MEQICASQTTKINRRQASNCIKYMKVTTVADLADIHGKMIPSHRLKGNWRATPDNNRVWPNAPKPKPNQFAALQKCLRWTICRTKCPHRQANYSLDLPLGNWVLYERNIVYKCYAVEHGYMWREENRWYNMLSIPNQRQGIYYIDKATQQHSPIESHPVPY